MSDWISTLAAVFSTIISFGALVHSIRTANKNSNLIERVDVLQTKIDNQSFTTGGGGGGGFGGAGGDGGSIYVGENRDHD